MKNKNLSLKQQGLTLIELLVYLAIFAIVSVAIYGLYGGVLSGTKIEHASQEITILKTAAETYRRTSVQAGLYTNLSVQRLAGRGYNVKPFTTGSGENTYGLDATLASANSNTDATLTYQMETAEDCNQLVDRFTGLSGVKGTPSCSGSTFTLGLE